MEARQVTEIQGNRNSKWYFKDTEIVLPMENREREYTCYIFTLLLTSGAINVKEDAKMKTVQKESKITCLDLIKEILFLPLISAAKLTAFFKRNLNTSFRCVLADLLIQRQFQRALSIPLGRRYKEVLHYH